MRSLALRRVAYVLILCSSLTVLLTGCSLGQVKGPSSPADMAKDQTLKAIVPVQESQNGFGLDGNSVPLDPALYVWYSETAIQPVTLLFDGLVTLDRNEHVEPWAAQSWTISPDGLTYTFTLRPNLRFSDGTPLKASDYAWSFDRLANPCLIIGNYNVEIDDTFLVALKDAQSFDGERCVNGNPTGARATLVGDSIRPNDSANTLTFILAQPAGYFLNALTMPFASVLERSVVGPGLGGGDETWTQHLTDGRTGQGGSGMFYLAQMVRGANNTISQEIFKPNPHWWGIQAGKRPHFTEIDLVAVADNLSLDTFQNDPNIAYGGTIGSKALEQHAPELKNQPYYHAQPTLYTTALVFNETQPPFDDINMRKALCLAINRDQLEANHLLYKGGRSGWDSFGPVPPNYPPLYQGSLVPSWHLVPEGMDGYNAQLHGLENAPVSGNPTLAKQYWQKYLAAHGNQAPQIQMVVRGTGNIERASSYNWLQALGITVQLWSPEFPAAEVVQSDDPWAIEYTNINFADPAEAFLSGLTSRSSIDFIPLQTDVPVADALLQRAATLTDMGQRVPLYHQAEQLLINNADVCPLFQSMTFYALRPWVKGNFVTDAFAAFPRDAWVSGYIAKH